MNFLIIQLLTFFINLALGVFILSKNAKNIVNQSFGIFAIAAAFWGLSFVFILNLSSPELQLIWSKFGISFGSIFAAGLLLFSVVFPRKNLRFQLKRRIIIIVGTIFTIVPFFMVESVQVNDGMLTGTFNNLQHFWAIYVLLFFSLTFFNLIRKYFKFKGAQKEQERYLIIGLSLFIFPMILTDIVLPNMLGIFKYNTLGPTFTIPMIALIAYTLTRHSFLDIRIIIQRSVIYTSLFAIVVGFYLAMVFILGSLFQSVTNLTVSLSATLAVATGIFGVPPLERYFRRITDKIFFKDKYDYSKALHELSEILNNTLDLKETLNKSERKLKEIFKVNYIHFILTSEETDLAKEIDGEFERKHEIIINSEIPSILNNSLLKASCRKTLTTIQEIGKQYNATITAPIVLEEKVIGFIILSKKLSGDAYTEEDLTLLKTFSCQAAVALEKAELYETIREYSLKLEGMVIQRTGKIQKLQEEQKQMMLDISHGLQTPLTVIKGELDFLKKQIPNNEKVRTLDRSIDEVSGFIYDLLKICAKSFLLIPIPVSFMLSLA